MIVVDTNVIGYLYLSGERSEQAERALLKDALWSAPLLWRSELRNVLALYIKREALGLEAAQRIMEEATSLMFGREYEVASARVLSLAASSGCSACDCEFVALAQDLGVPLVTAERRILSEFTAIAVALEQFVAG